MKKFLQSAAFVAVVGCAVALMPSQLAAQQKRVSPHETVSKVYDRTNRVTLVYGRPYAKDPRSGQTRKIWGTLVPYGKVWRVGADEATLLITQQPIKMGDATIPAGAHTLFLLPAEDGATKLIVNNQLGQWGLQYDEKQDLARVEMKKETVDQAADQFTMELDNATGGGGVLKLRWENTQFSVPFTTQK